MQDRKKEHVTEYEDSEELEEIAEEALGIEIQREMSFGGEDESIIDVLDEADKDAHHRGLHMDEPASGCPWCPDPDNEHVSDQIYDSGAEEHE